MNKNDIFNIQSISDFEHCALEIFHFQAQQNLVYKSFLAQLKVDIRNIEKIEDMGFPYLASCLLNNELTYLEALNHILNCFYETTEDEFPAVDYQQLELLVQDFFNFNQPTI